MSDIPSSSRIAILNTSGAVTVGMILSAAILGWSIYASRASTDSVTVKGLASRDVISDTVTWNGSFTRTTPGDQLRQGYALMAEDEKRVLKFFGDHGLAQADAVIIPVSVSQPFRTDSKLARETTFKEGVTIVSHDLPAVANAVRSLSDLIDTGVQFQTDSVSYSYSKLPELRVSLLSEAMRDARSRAEKIVEATGQRVGRVKDTSVGAVQVLSANSSGNEYENSTEMKKQIVVTVDTTFVIK